MGKKIAMLSPVGGQGCTFASAYVASAIAESGAAVTAVDLCGFGGTLAHALGVEEQVSMNLGDVAFGCCAIEDAALVCDLPDLRLVPPSSFSRGNVSPFCAEYMRIVDEISRRSVNRQSEPVEADGGADEGADNGGEGDDARSESHDSAEDADGDEVGQVVLADVPSGAVPDADAVNCFDAFVVCSTADRFNLGRAASLCRVLANTAADCGAECEVRLLLTEFSPAGLRRSGLRDLDECIDIAGARLLGIIPYDEAARRAAEEGRVPDLFCEAMRYSRDVAGRLFGEVIPLEHKSSVF